MENYLVDGPITDDIILKIIRDDSDDLLAGASSLFLGRVRADAENEKRVTSIEYSAFPEMVSSQADGIITGLKLSFPDVRKIVILHSTGVVKAGEVSLIIKVTAGHRDEATRACRDALEKIKESFPVWKKELFDDATSAWKQE